jgi:hypothetical protein
MATKGADEQIRQFLATPEEIRSQYIDPVPKFQEGKKLIEATLEVIELN